MDIIKKVFSSYSREEICAIVKRQLDEAQEERFVRGGFWLNISYTYAAEIQDALEKHMRLPYSYHYDVDHYRWRVSIIHMPK